MYGALNPPYKQGRQDFLLGLGRTVAAASIGAAAGSVFTEKVMIREQNMENTHALRVFEVFKQHRVEEYAALLLSIQAKLAELNVNAAELDQDVLSTALGLPAGSFQVDVYILGVQLLTRGSYTGLSTSVSQYLPDAVQNRVVRLTIKDFRDVQELSAGESYFISSYLDPQVRRDNEAAIKPYIAGKAEEVLGRLQFSDTTEAFHSSYAVVLQSFAKAFPLFILALSKIDRILVTGSIQSEDGVLNNTELLRNSGVLSSIMGVEGGVNLSIQPGHTGWLSSYDGSLSSLVTFYDCLVRLGMQAVLAHWNDPELQPFLSKSNLVALAEATLPNQESENIDRLSRRTISYNYPLKNGPDAHARFASIPFMSLTDAELNAVQQCGVLPISSNNNQMLSKLGLLVHHAILDSESHYKRYRYENDYGFEYHDSLCLPKNEEHESGFYVYDVYFHPELKDYYILLRGMDPELTSGVIVNAAAIGEEASLAPFAIEETSESSTINRMLRLVYRDSAESMTEASELQGVSITEVTCQKVQIAISTANVASVSTQYWISKIRGKNTLQRVCTGTAGLDSEDGKIDFSLLITTFGARGEYVVVPGADTHLEVAAHIPVSGTRINSLNFDLDADTVVLCNLETERGLPRASWQTKLQIESTNLGFLRKLMDSGDFKPRDILLQQTKEDTAYYQVILENTRNGQTVSIPVTMLTILQFTPEEIK